MRENDIFFGVGEMKEAARVGVSDLRMARAVLMGRPGHIVGAVEIEIVEHRAAGQILLLHAEGQVLRNLKRSPGNVDAVGVGVAAVLIVLFHF